MGLVGLSRWPSINQVVHEDPTTNIRVTGAVLADNSRLQVNSISGIVEEFASVGGMINIPADVVVNATARRLSLRLFINDVKYGGDVLFLPIQESEEFSIPGALTKNGGNYTWDAYSRTDYINVAGSKEIVVSLLVSSSALSAVYAYDAERKPLRILLPFSPSQYESVHVVIDADVVFVRACSTITITPSLYVYFE